MTQMHFSAEVRHPSLQARQNMQGNWQNHSYMQRGPSAEEYAYSLPYSKIYSRTISSRNIDHAVQAMRVNTFYEQHN
jgi:hypothetical protein